MVKRIDPKASKSKRMTALLYGASGSGKTTWAGTWPRPLFLSMAVEGGHTSFLNMPAQDRYYPNEEPLAPFLIENPVKDIREVFNVELPALLKGKNPPETVVFDSLSFYSDMLEVHFKREFAAQVAKDGWFLWKHLKDEIMRLRDEVNRLPVNVVWLALDHVDKSGRGGPMIAGGAQGAFLPSVDFAGYQQYVASKEADVPGMYETRTRPVGCYPARHRYGDKIPDPLPFPDYRSIEEALNA
jgi:hypothetical protein